MKILEWIGIKMCDKCNELKESNKNLRNNIKKVMKVYGEERKKVEKLDEELENWADYISDVELDNRRMVAVIKKIFDELEAYETHEDSQDCIDTIKILLSKYEELSKK